MAPAYVAAECLACCLAGRGIGRGVPAVLLTMEILMQSIIEILLVTVKEGTSKKTNNPYKISEAHCVLRNDDGTPGAVGVLVVPKALEAVAKPGLFTAGFSLQAGSFGENQGRIMAVLAGLSPVPAAALKPSRAA
jgi:hypothetical protein